MPSRKNAWEAPWNCSEKRKARALEYAAAALPATRRGPEPKAISLGGLLLVNAAFLLLTSAWLAGADAVPAPVAAPVAGPAVSSSCGGCDTGCAVDCCCPKKKHPLCSMFHKEK